jgi:hypothetical protein
MKTVAIRAGVLFFAFTMLLSAFTSCAADPTPEVTTDASSTLETQALETPTEPETEAETEVVKSYITLNSSNFSKVKIIRSNSLSKFSTEVELVNAFRKQINSRLNSSISVTNDTLSQNASEDGFGIFVGDTINAISVELNSKLAALGTNAYGIIARENVIAVSATNSYLLYKALDRLMVDCISKDDNGALQLKIEDGYELIEDKDIEYPNPEEIINSGKNYAFYSIEKLASVPTKGNYSVLEGGGTDGKYAYYAMINKSTKPETSYVYKYDIETWELVATSKSLPTAHTNDITYDSKNNRLVVSYCANKEGTTMSASGIVFLNPDDLSFIEYIDAPTISRALDYIPEKNQYVLAAGYTFYITDENFNTISSFKCGYQQLTTQGLCTDGKYIYDPRWKSGAKYQTITINTLDGEFIGAVPAYNIDGEPENIFRDGNSFVMGCNSSDSVFRLVLLYEGWWG